MPLSKERKSWRKVPNLQVVRPYCKTHTALKRGRLGNTELQQRRPCPMTFG